MNLGPPLEGPGLGPGTDTAALDAAAKRVHCRGMGYAHFAPCPHCSAPLSFLEGVAGSKMNPECPCCHQTVAVTHATFLMEDHSRPRVGGAAKPPA